MPPAALASSSRPLAPPDFLRAATRPLKHRIWRRNATSPPAHDSPVRRTAWFLSAYFVCLTSVGLAGESPTFSELAGRFTREIRPLLNEHCLKCHATDVQEGTLDLEQFATLDDVRRQTSTWQKVAEMLDNGEMPPKKAPQPSPRTAPAAARLGGRLPTG